MKETFYFSHDYNSRGDEKTIKLISKLGWEGYGLYWAIIEKLYEADGYIEKDYECIAYDLRTECERIENIVNNFELFDTKDNKIFSQSVLDRLQKRHEKSDKAKKSAEARWGKNKGTNANALPTQSDSNAIKESKVKESKVNNSKEYLEVLAHFNLLANTQLKDTPTKKKNIEKFLKHFTLEEIKYGLDNRSKSKWHIENYQVKNWEATFGRLQSIDKFEAWTQTNEKAQTKYNPRGQ